MFLSYACENNFCIQFRVWDKQTEWKVNWPTSSANAQHKNTKKISRQFWKLRKVVYFKKSSKYGMAFCLFYFPFCLFFFPFCICCVYSILFAFNRLKIYNWNYRQVVLYNTNNSLAWIFPNISILKLMQGISVNSHINQFQYQPHLQFYIFHR